jgi:N-acetylglutamate synthase-like GNAT family acetyltransferase
MAQFTIRRFVPSDAKALAIMIRRNLMEVNIRDYPREEMERVAAGYSEDGILRLAAEAHLYVACAGGEAVGCGAITRGTEDPKACTISAVFVSPGLHGAGAGRMIMGALENDALFCQSRRADLMSSLTARGFYEKLSYRYAHGDDTPGKGMVFRMEKTRVPADGK